MTHHESIQEVKASMKQATNPRDYERYQAVYLSLSGLFQSRNRPNHQPVRAHGQELYPRLQRKRIVWAGSGESAGKKSNLTDEQRALLKETIAYKRPDEVGFPARANWTLSLGAQWIEHEFGVSYTLKGVAKLLHALGFSYTRPTYILKKADPKRQRHFKEETFPAFIKS